MSALDLTSTGTHVGVLRVDTEGRWPVDHFLGLLGRLDGGYTDAGHFLQIARAPQLLEEIVQEEREKHGEDELDRAVRRHIRHLGDPSVPQLLLKSVEHHSPGWVEVLGAWNPLKVVADFISQWRAENSARSRAEREAAREVQRQQMAYYLQLLDRMDPELKERYAVQLLDDSRTAAIVTAADPRLTQIELREASEDESKEAFR